MTDCLRKDANVKRCTCSYPGCPRHGVCCECLEYHWSRKELPGCLFPKDVEATWDRDLSTFIKTWQAKGF